MTNTPTAHVKQEQDQGTAQTQQHDDQHQDLPQNPVPEEWEPIMRYLEEAQGYTAFLAQRIDTLEQNLMNYEGYNQFLGQKVYTLEQELMSLRAEPVAIKVPGMYSFKQLIETWIENSPKKEATSKKLSRILASVPSKTTSNRPAAIINFCKHQLQFNIDFPSTETNDRHVVRCKYPHFDYFLSNSGIIEYSKKKEAKDIACLETIARLNDEPDFLYRLIAWQAPTIFMEPCKELYELFFHSPIRSQETLPMEVPLCSVNAANYYNPYESYAASSSAIVNQNTIDNSQLIGSNTIGNSIVVSDPYSDRTSVSSNDQSVIVQSHGFESRVPMVFSEAAKPMSNKSDSSSDNSGKAIYTRKYRDDHERDHHNDKQSPRRERDYDRDYLYLRESEARRREEYRDDGRYGRDDRDSSRIRDRSRSYERYERDSSRMRDRNDSREKGRYRR